MGKTLEQNEKLSPGHENPSPDSFANPQHKDNAKDYGILQSRINSALRSRLNKEENHSESLLKTRSDSDKSAFGKKEADGESNDNDSASKISSTYIRARMDQWETVKRELHGEFLNLVNFEEIKGISDSKLNERLRAAIEEFVNSKIPPEFAHYG